MSPLVRLVVFLAAAAAASAFLRKPKWIRDTKPDLWMSSVELAKWHGYRMETHQLETSDGYILQLHRVPTSKNGTRGDVPMLFGHGLCSSDEQWLARRKDGVVWALSEAGYDVWLANYRGSFYSRKHKTLTPKDHDFWDFSWHENGVIDQAESIDYILNLTGHKNLIFMGHSMSVTAQVVLLALRPEYNKKIRGQVLLSPPASFKHPVGFMAYTSKMIRTLPGVMAASAEYVENDIMAGLDRPFPRSCFGPNHGSSTTPKKLQDHCLRLLEFVMGKIYTPMDMNEIHVIMHHYPGGSSIRQVMHYAQCFLSGIFRPYDFGKDRNQELYGRDDPPPYNLTQIDTPTYVLYSKGDATVHWKDAEDFAKALRPGVIKKMHRLPDSYCHIDYLIAPDAKEVVYKYMLQYSDEIRKLE